MSALIKCYHNNTCSNELKENVEGNYLLDISPISSRVTNNYTKLVYLKNEGNHKAFNLSAAVTTNISGKISCSLNKTSLVVDETAVLTITIAIAQGDSLSGDIALTLAYDNLD
jgi:hypothetical protein